MRTNFDLLLEKIEKKPLVLFVGAGINAELVPLWKELLDKLFIYAINRLEYDISNDQMEKISSFTTQKSVYYKASFIKKMLGPEYLHYLQDIIYSKYIEKKKKVFDGYAAIKTGTVAGYESLYLIADLCATGEVHAVVNYNYDNILTQLINFKKKDNYAVDEYHYRRPEYEEDENLNPKPKDKKDEKLMIYHVHGFIPPPDQVFIDAPENVVLAYDEYFFNMMNPYSWQTTTQLYFLMNYTCLFVGTSLSDWNMLRMLAHAKVYSNSKDHFLLTVNEKSKEIQWDRGKEIINKINATVMTDAGIHVIYVEDIPEIHSKLKELYTTLNENKQVRNK